MITSLFPTRIEAVGRHLDWSPDGKYLVAADKKSADEPFGIVLIEASTGHKIQVTSPPAGMIGDTGPAFSPDGKSIAFIRAISSGVDDIFITSLAGNDVRRITADRRYIISLAWLPDGNSIVFSTNRLGAHSLWRVGATGGAIERVPGISENVSDPVFARNGKRFAYSQFYVDTNIWRMDNTTGEIRQFITSTQYDSSPQFSPDGKRVAFRSNRSGHNEIWIADVDSPSTASQLTRIGSTLTGCPRWSPDGRSIACDARPDGPADIFVIDASTGEPKQLTTGPSEDVVPSWSNDGNWVYFCFEPQWILRRSGRFPRRRAPRVQVTHQGGFAPFESPDGRYVYYAKGRTVSGLVARACRGRSGRAGTESFETRLLGLLGALQWQPVLRR